MKPMKISTQLTSINKIIIDRVVIQFSCLMILLKFLCPDFILDSLSCILSTYSHSNKRHISRLWHCIVSACIVACVVLCFKNLISLCNDISFFNLILFSFHCDIILVYVLSLLYSPLTFSCWLRQQKQHHKLWVYRLLRASQPLCAAASCVFVSFLKIFLRRHPLLLRSHRLKSVHQRVSDKWVSGTVAVMSARHKINPYKRSAHFIEL